MTRVQRQFISRIKKSIKQAKKLDDVTVKGILTYLNTSRERIISNLAVIPPEKWKAWYLREMLGMIDGEIREFTERTTLALNGAEVQSFEMAKELQDKIGATVNLRTFIAEPSREILTIGQDYSAMLIRGLSDDLRKKVSADLSLGIISGKTPFEIMGDIGRSINKGTFKTIADRAETIVRTELGRISGMTDQARIEQMAEYEPKERKEWISVIDERTRPEHAEANGQIVLWDEPFIVGNEELMYPGDPAGSAWNTLNCRCKSVPLPPEEAPVTAKLGRPEELKELAMEVI